MMKLLPILLLLILLPPLTALPQPVKLKVAVLEFTNEAGLTKFEVETLSDDVRGAALVLPPDRHLIMTRESLMAMLPPGTDLAKCSDGQCEVEAGRMVGADFVVAGSVGKFAGKFVVRLKLFDTRTAALLGQASAGGAGLEALREDLGRKAAELFDQGVGERRPGKPVAVAPRTDEVGTVRPEVGMLRVEGTPRGAQVILVGPERFGDHGRMAATLPYGPVEVPAGPYRLLVSNPGFDAEGRAAFVPADRTAVVQVDLAASEGVLEVAGTPTGARVELSCAKDFAKVFGLPGTLSVPRGSCTVAVARTGYEPFQRVVEVPPGGRARVEVALVEVPVPATVPMPVAEPARTVTPSEPAPGPGPEPPSSPREEDRPSKGFNRGPWPWVSLGSGAALVVGGGVMTWLASHERSIVSNVTQKDGVVTGMTHPEAMAHLDKASTYDKVSYAFYTLGAAAMVTGVVLWLVLPPDREVSGTGAPAAFTLAPVPGGGILGASGRF